MHGREAATSSEGRITSPVLPSSEPSSKDAPQLQLRAVAHQRGAVLHKEMEGASKTWAGETALEKDQLIISPR